MLVLLMVLSVLPDHMLDRNIYEICIKKKVYNIPSLLKLYVCKA